MEKLNNLTKKEFWSEGWKKIKLPARFFYGNYSHVVISDLIDQHVEGNVYEKFLEIGGCPGRWADYFFAKFEMECDSMDYDQNNIDITNKNYKLIGIKGRAFLGDITKVDIPNKKYDVVLSDGLIEHFVDSNEVFNNHVKYLNKNGLLIVGVPNIKNSCFYNFFAKRDKIGYAGYRHVSREELISYARKNDLKILYCDYIGVFNIGLVHSYTLNFLIAKLFVLISMISDILFKLLRVKKESKLFSPYIYIIAKKI